MLYYIGELSFVAFFYLQKRRRISSIFVNLRISKKTVVAPNGVD